MNFMKMSFLSLRVALVLLLVGEPPLVLADGNPVLEAKIEMRVMDFISEPADRMEVAVLYEGGNAESLHDAGRILQALQQSAGLARSKFTARLMEIRMLNGADGLKAVVLAAGIDDADAKVLRYGIEHHTLVMSAGLDCVRNGQCMVGVKIAPEVEIGVNSDIIRRSSIRFADGFQWMVKEY